MGKELPSGLYITDEGLREIADRLAMETFYQEDVSLRDAFFYAGLDELIRETPAEYGMMAAPSDKDVEAIFDAVAPVASDLLCDLRNHYGISYEEHVAYHTW